MKRLTKSQIKEMTKFQNDLENLWGSLEGSLEAYHTTLIKQTPEMLETIWQDIQKAQAEYNAILIDLRNWASSIAAEIQRFIDSKSENWQEGDTGAAYAEWMSQFEDFEPEGISLSKEDGGLDDYEAPEDIFGNLSSEMDL
jgi:DNA repair exonuclease SbcCD ATPase subunit